MATLDKAISIAAQAFEGVYDKGGSPYILHCLWVMHKVRHLGKDAMIVAILHDVPEDTDWTLDMLRAEGFSETVITAIDCVTYPDRCTEEEYLERTEIIVKPNYLARNVKMRDLEHNSKITRIKAFRDKDIARVRKYQKAYQILKKANLLAQAEFSTMERV